MSEQNNTNFQQEETQQNPEIQQSLNQNQEQIQQPSQEQAVEKWEDAHLEYQEDDKHEEEQQNQNKEKDQNQNYDQDEIQLQSSKKFRSRSRSRSKSRDRKRKTSSSHHHHSNKRKYSDNEKMKNGCCKKCLKAFSKTGKSCICQVPSDVRKIKLSKDGCQICGCHGCHPYDFGTVSNMKREQSNTSNHTHNHNNNNNHSSSRHSNQQPRRKRSYDQSSDDETYKNLNNFENSKLGNLVNSNLQVFPPLIGFCIPQRSYSYLTGKPQKRKY